MCAESCKSGVYRLNYLKIEIFNKLCKKCSWDFQFWNFQEIVENLFIFSILWLISENHKIEKKNKISIIYFLWCSRHFVNFDLWFQFLEIVQFSRNFTTRFFRWRLCMTVFILLGIVAMILTMSIKQHIYNVDPRSPNTIEPVQGCQNISYTKMSPKYYQWELYSSMSK